MQDLAVLHLAITGLVFGLLLLSLASNVYYITVMVCAVQFPWTTDRSAQHPQPPVTILKPLCGIAPNTFRDLASFCVQDYPQYQIIFAVRDSSDPVLPIVYRLMEIYSHLDLDVVVSDHSDGPNHKVNNLANAATVARHEIYVLADSDIRVHPDYLSEVIQPLHRRQVGAVTCMYRSRPDSWLAAFETLATSTEFLPGVLVARRLEGISFALGATIVIRRSVLDAIGGFPFLSQYLADDYILGQRCARLHQEVVLSSTIVDHSVSTSSLGVFLLHQLRWFRGNRFSRPWGYLGLLFTYGTVSSFLLLLVSGGSRTATVVFLSTWFLRIFMGWVVGVRCLKDVPASALFLLTPIRDFFSFMIWCWSFLGSDVFWQGRRLRLTSGGRISEGLS